MERVNSPDQRNVDSSQTDSHMRQAPAVLRLAVHFKRPAGLSRRPRSPELSCASDSAPASRLLFGHSRSVDGRFMDWQPLPPTFLFVTCAKRWITVSLSSAPRLWPALFCMPVVISSGADRPHSLLLFFCQSGVHTC